MKKHNIQQINASLQSTGQSLFIIFLGGSFFGYFVFLTDSSVTLDDALVNGIAFGVTMGVLVRAWKYSKNNFQRIGNTTFRRIVKFVFWPAIIIFTAIVTYAAIIFQNLLYIKVPIIKTLGFLFLPCGFVLFLVITTFVLLKYHLIRLKIIQISNGKEKLKSVQDANSMIDLCLFDEKYSKADKLSSLMIKNAESGDFNKQKQSEPHSEV